jgi:hypothetical protein
MLSVRNKLIMCVMMPNVITPSVVILSVAMLSVAEPEGSKIAVLIFFVI